MDGVVEVDHMPMRQVPTYAYSFSGSSWVSEDGILRHRYFDPLSSTWNWGDIRRPVFDARGRIGHHVYGRFRTIEQIIALAWVPRRKPMTRLKRVKRRDIRSDVTAHNLYWSDEEDSDDGDSDDTEAGDDTRTKPLLFKMGMVPCVNSHLSISERGTLYTPHGAFRGRYALGPCRFYPVSNVGLVPLNLAAQLIFAGERDRRLTSPPPRIARVIRHLRRGLSVHDVALAAGVREATAWSYAHVALRHMSTPSARKIVEKLLAHTPRVIKALEKLATESPLVVGGRLSDVVHVLTRVFAADPSWREYAHRYSVVCMARTLLQREQQ